MHLFSLINRTYIYIHGARTTTPRSTSWIARGNKQRYLGAARTTPPQGRLGGVAVGAHPNNTQIWLAARVHVGVVPCLMRPSPRLLPRSTTGIGSGLPRDPHLGRRRRPATSIHRPATDHLVQLPHIVWIVRGRLDHVVTDALHSRERRREDTTRS